MNLFDRVLFEVNTDIRDRALELIVISLIILYVAFYYWGKKKNLSIAKAWAFNARKCMESQFAQLGYDKGHLLLENSPEEYAFYASGRQYCRYLYANLQVIEESSGIRTEDNFFFIL
jgi:hypothetical protein